MLVLAKRLLHRLRAERGQALILFVGIITITFVVGAIAIDFGLWFSERRGAQKDADLVTLAGVYELLDDSPDACAKAAEKSDEWAADNGLDPLDDIHNFDCRPLDFPDAYEAEPGCGDLPNANSRPNAVYLDIDHETRALFAGIFGIAAPEVGSHACARAGSLTSTLGLRPWAVPMLTSACFGPDTGDYDGDGDTAERAPLYGANCVFRDGDESSTVGSIRLGDEPDDPCSEPGSSGGAQRYRENILEGSDADCSIGEIVSTEPGQISNSIDTVAELLSTQGECDALNGSPPDGIDQFDESFVATTGDPAVPGPDVTFVPRNDCVTPRAIDLVIIDEFVGNGRQDQAIVGFASFFLEGCEDVDTGEFFQDCDTGPGNPGNIQIRGFFLSILKTEGDIGDFDQFGTKAIRLVE